MTLVALQPSGKAASRAHFVNTIESPVPQATLAEHLSPSQMERVQAIYGNRAVPTWGVTPGEKDVNVGKWQRLEVGSVALFAGQGHVFASGVVTMKFRDEELARKLWDNDGDGQTWEYMYLLDEVFRHRIPYPELNAVADYQPNYVIQGFNVLSPEKSAAILSTFELQSLVHFPEEPDPDIEAGVVDQLELDREGRAMLRGEQQLLRRRMFGRQRTNACAICGEAYPIELLVAAHIKKRSRCTDSEKRDLANVAAPMCKLGCDELFERGYIAVDGDHVVLSPHLNRTPGLDRILGRLGAVRIAASSAQQSYYAWHHANIFKA